MSECDLLVCLVLKLLMKKGGNTRHSSLSGKCLFCFSAWCGVGVVVQLYVVTRCLVFERFQYRIDDVRSMKEDILCWI